MRPGLDTEFFDLPLPRVIAHRGASGDYPENTLPAFTAAHSMGASYFEFDLHLTRDGEIVVIHDDDLRRVAAHPGIISDITIAELASADAGHNFIRDGGFPFRGQGIRVPSLAEVFAAFPHQRFILEIKQISSQLVPAMLQVIDRAKMRRRVLIASEHQAPIDEVRALAPGIPTNLPTPEVGRFMMSLAPGAPSYDPRGEALQIPPEHDSWKLVCAESVAAAHRLGLEMHVWTVNDAAAMRAILALGVDGILTDYPARLLDLLRPS
jgi:glycerophosphoryl diester phosphodiesterase